ncbi:MAG: hypothetical protein ACYCQI_15190 [Gammaproteobacteria bacterium]
MDTRKDKDSEAKTSRLPKISKLEPLSIKHWTSSELRYEIKHGNPGYSYHSYYPDYSESAFARGNGFSRLRSLEDWEIAKQYNGALLIDFDETVIDGDKSEAAGKPCFLFKKDLSKLIKAAHQNKFFVAIVTGRGFSQLVSSVLYNPKSTCIIRSLFEIDPDLRLSHIFYTGSYLSKASVCHFINSEFSIPYNKMVLLDDLPSYLEPCKAIGVHTVLTTSTGTHFSELLNFINLHSNEDVNKTANSLGLLLKLQELATHFGFFKRKTATQDPKEAEIKNSASIPRCQEKKVDIQLSN